MIATGGLSPVSAGRLGGCCLSYLFRLCLEGVVCEESKRCLSNSQIAKNL